MMVAVREAGLVPDLDMLSAATEACSKAGNTKGALHFVDQALRLGFAPDGRMYREVGAYLSFKKTYMKFFHHFLLLLLLQS